MAYMKREERRADILDAVIAVASTDGFAAATIRRIASDLGIAVGAIHHIFDSSAELKREAFRLFAKRSLHWMAELEHGETVIDRLVPFLCPPDDPIQTPRVFMWREALNEAARDEEFAVVYGEAMDLWHRQLVDIMLDGRNDPAERARSEAIAWRLMALSSGFTGFSRVPTMHVASADFEAHVRHILTLELQHAPA